MVSQGLIIASEVTGFISFAFTLLTLLGVYRDLLSTLRNAATQIPILLGNLRQEILTEKAFLQYRIKQGDSFDVFPRKLRSVGGASGPSLRRDIVKHQFSRLMEATIRDLWIEFRNVERPFLISNPMRAEAVEKGDYWGDNDVEEKPRLAQPSKGRRGRRRGKGDVEKGGGGDGEGVSPMRMTKEGIEAVGARYYRTDMAHRFIWWQSKSNVERLMDQVQRIQIRRLERDIFEADELIKRVCLAGGMGGSGGGGGGGSSGSGSGSDGGRRGVGRRGSVASVRSRAGSGRSVRMPSRRGSGNFREVEEVRRVRRTVPERAELVGRSEGEASNTGRRRERRGQRVEYEVIRPGSVYVVDDGGGRSGGRGYAYEDDSRGLERRRSYSRGM